MFKSTFLALLLLASVATYTPSVALNLGYMSSIAYESAASINAWSCSRCSKYPLINVKAFDNSVGDIQGFTGFSSSLNGIVLAFRGSSNLQNWIINLSTNQVPYPRCTNCKVHNGFVTGYNLVKTIISGQLQALRALHRGAPIYITGHSLGGALAVLSAPDTKDLFGSIAGLYTFGQPRVGNAEFASYFNSVVGAFRVVHYGDLVPHVPPSAFSFVHSSTEIWYDEAMATYKTCSGDSSGCSNSLPATSLNTGDHSMDLYLKLRVAQNIFTMFFEYLGNLEINVERGQHLFRHTE